MFLKVSEVIPEVKTKMDELIQKGPSNNYDLQQDKILLDQAVKFIKENPLNILNCTSKNFYLSCLLI